MCVDNEQTDIVTCIVVDEREMFVMCVDNVPTCLVFLLS